MKDFIRRNRIRLNRDLNSMEKRRYLSSLVDINYIYTLETLNSHASGKLIDVGCGDAPYRRIIEPNLECYHTLDVEKRTSKLDFISDILDMNAVSDCQYDTVLCLEVLEHVSDPFKAMKEISRILKPGGKLILSVPHISRIHEAPHDYFRFTNYGIEKLLEHSNMKLCEVKCRGGLLSFIDHQISSLFVCFFWGIPLIKWIVFWLNKWILVKPITLIEKITGRKRLMPTGYICIGQKESE